MLTNDAEAMKFFEKAQLKDDQGDHKGCLEDSIKFFQYAEKTGNKSWACTAACNIGIGYNTIGDHEKAIEYHLKHFELAVALGDKKGQEEANENISICEQLILATAKTKKTTTSTKKTKTPAKKDATTTQTTAAEAKTKKATTSTKKTKTPAKKDATTTQTTAAEVANDKKSTAKNDNLTDTNVDDANTQEEWVFGYIPLYNTGYEDNRYDDNLISILNTENSDLINARDSEGNTIFIIACQHQKMDLIKLIASKGADLSAKNNANYTALEYAVANKHAEVVELFVEIFNENASSKSSEWSAIVDDSSGNVYYHNTATEETVWEMPTI